MTKQEWHFVKALIGVLDAEIEAVGGCDHAVGICDCGNRRLREDAQTYERIYDPMYPL